MTRRIEEQAQTDEEYIQYLKAYTEGYSDAIDYAVVCLEKKGEAVRRKTNDAVAKIAKGRADA